MWERKKKYDFLSNQFHFSSYTQLFPPPKKKNTINNNGIFYQLKLIRSEWLLLPKIPNHFFSPLFTTKTSWWRLGGGGGLCNVFFLSGNEATKKSTLTTYYVTSWRLPLLQTDLEYYDIRLHKKYRYHSFPTKWWQQNFVWIFLINDKNPFKNSIEDQEDFLKHIFYKAMMTNISAKKTSSWTTTTSEPRNKSN